MFMKVLFIGGTGIISTAITQRLADDKDCELWLLNRGRRSWQLPDSVRTITADIHDESDVRQKLTGMRFDAVVDFIAYTPDHIERDIRLFEGGTGQYIFISSASAYQKPLSNYLITESTPLANPYWQYSRYKIDCEELLVRQYRETGFPVTIVRPSHTYSDFSVPVGLHGENGSWQVLDRMRNGKPIIVHGDGATLWTMTHNTDFAKGFIGLMNNPRAIGEAVHITSDESLTWNQIYNIIGGCLGVEPLLCHIATNYLVAADPNVQGGLIGDKANSVVFDNTKLKRLVPGFCATVRFDQGIARSIRSFLDTPSLQTPDPVFDDWCDRVIAEYTKSMEHLRGAYISG
jgi:nucleoside-diphosphate-sugar epimerase